MEPTRLATPLIRVRRESDPEKTVEIQTTNRELVLWDRTRVKHKWPKFDDAPFLWMTFLSWAGARRQGLIPPDFTYEAWEADVLEVDVLDGDQEGEEGNPTHVGHVPE